MKTLLVVVCSLTFMSRTSYMWQRILSLLLGWVLLALVTKKAYQGRGVGDEW